MPQPYWMGILCLILPLMACVDTNIGGLYESQVRKGLVARIVINPDGTSITVSNPYDEDQHPFAGWRQRSLGKEAIYELTIRDGIEKYVYADKFECWLNPENPEVLIARYFLDGMHGRTGRWKKCLLGRIQEAP